MARPPKEQSSSQTVDNPSEAEKFKRAYDTQKAKYAQKAGNQYTKRLKNTPRAQALKSAPNAGEQEDKTEMTDYRQLKNNLRSSQLPSAKFKQQSSSKQKAKQPSLYDSFDSIEQPKKQDPLRKIKSGRVAKKYTAKDEKKHKEKVRKLTKPKRGLKSKIKKFLTPWNRKKRLQKEIQTLQKESQIREDQHTAGMALQKQREDGTVKMEQMRQTFIDQTENQNDSNKEKFDAVQKEIEQQANNLSDLSTKLSPITAEITELKQKNPDDEKLKNLNNQAAEIANEQGRLKNYVKTLQNYRDLYRTEKPTIKSVAHDWQSKNGPLPEEPWDENFITQMHNLLDAADSRYNANQNLSEQERQIKVSGIRDPMGKIKTPSQIFEEEQQALRAQITKRKTKVGIKTDEPTNQDPTTVKPRGNFRQQLPLEMQGPIAKIDGGIPKESHTTKAIKVGGPKISEMDKKTAPQEETQKSTIPVENERVELNLDFFDPNDLSKGFSLELDSIAPPNEFQDEVTMPQQESDLYSKQFEDIMENALHTEEVSANQKPNIDPQQQFKERASNAEDKLRKAGAFATLDAQNLDSNSPKRSFQEILDDPKNSKKNPRSVYL